jgi:hypothetical protein
MSRLTLIIPLALLLTTTTLVTPAEATRGYRGASQVIVNGQAMSPALRLALVRRGVRIPAGRYWYDARCGAWGYEGGPTRGFITAGLRLGGRLKASASSGRSGVFVNGRQLTHGESYALQRLVGRFARGHYWVDRYGNAGRVGGPALVNLRVLAARASGGSGGRSGGNSNWLIRGGKYGGRSGMSMAGDGKTTCVNVSGYSRCY